MKKSIILLFVTALLAGCDNPMSFTRIKEIGGFDTRVKCANIGRHVHIGYNDSNGRVIWSYNNQIGGGKIAPASFPAVWAQIPSLDRQLLTQSVEPDEIIDIAQLAGLPNRTYIIVTDTAIYGGYIDGNVMKGGVKLFERAPRIEESPIVAATAAEPILKPNKKYVPKPKIEQEVETDVSFESEFDQFFKEREQ